MTTILSNGGRLARLNTQAQYGWVPDDDVVRRLEKITADALAHAADSRERANRMRATTREAGKAVDESLKKVERTRRLLAAVSSRALSGRRRARGAGVEP